MKDRGVNARKEEWTSKGQNSPLRRGQNEGPDTTPPIYLQCCCVRFYLSRSFSGRISMEFYQTHGIPSDTKLKKPFFALEVTKEV
jgi:hypothetical protein